METKNKNCRGVYSMTGKKNYIVVIAFVLISILAISCKKKDAGVRGESAVSVLSGAPIRQALDEYLDLSAEIKAIKEVQIYPDVPGKVSQITRYEGSLVNKGDTIAYIDRFVVGANYALAPVRTPLSGYVTTTYVTVGAAISQTSPIANVADISKLEVQINVPERNVNSIKLGQKILIRVPASPNKEIEATLNKRDYTVNPATRTLLVKGEIDNKERLLLPGMFSDVSILLNSADNVFVIPNTAVFTGDDGKSYVYVVEESKPKISEGITPNTTEKKTDKKSSKGKGNTNEQAEKKIYRSVLREINVLFPSRDKIAVSSGITDGEEIVMFGREFLKDGSLINPIRGDSSVAAFTAKANTSTNTTSTNAVDTVSKETNKTVNKAENKVSGEKKNKENTTIKATEIKPQANNEVIDVSKVEEKKEDSPSTEASSN